MRDKRAGEGRDKDVETTQDIEYLCPSHNSPSPCYAEGNDVEEDWNEAFDLGGRGG